MRDAFGIALIGCGMGARPHALALQELSASRTVCVRGVYARSADARAAFAATYGFPDAASIEALAADPSVHAALIVTPPNARADIVAAFAKAAKHILSEKPLERTEDAARGIVGTCEDAGVTLGVVVQHQFRKASEALATRLAEGAFGAIHLVGVQVPWWPAVGYLAATTASYPGDAESIRLDCARASVVLTSGVLDIHWRDLHRRRGRSDGLPERLAPRPDHRFHRIGAGGPGAPRHRAAGTGRAPADRGHRSLIGQWPTVSRHSGLT